MAGESRANAEDHNLHDADLSLLRAGKGIVAQEGSAVRRGRRVYGFRRAWRDGSKSKGSAHRATDIHWRSPRWRLRRTLFARQRRRARSVVACSVSRFRIACVQLRSSDDIDESVAVASDLIRRARSRGAEFVATPENTTLMAPDGGAKLERSFPEDRDPALPRFRALAEELGIWLLIGSLAIKVSDRKTANRSFLINPKGMVAARYSKIHLFDVNLPSGENYRESNTVAG